jgi:predicted nuclease with RNAse H fold
MRCAGLLTEAARRGARVDRAGTAGLVAEVYPAAALRRWALWRPGKKDHDVRAGLLADLRVAAPWLDLDAGAAALCARSHDALDALVCALVARAVALGQTTGPKPQDAEAAAVEGWIHLPEDGLAGLAP